MWITNWDPTQKFKFRNSKLKLKCINLIERDKVIAWKAELERNFKADLVGDEATWIENWKRYWSVVVDSIKLN